MVPEFVNELLARFGPYTRTNSLAVKFGSIDRFLCSSPKARVLRKQSVSLVPRHPPLSGRYVPGYSALLFQDGGRHLCILGPNLSGD